MSTELPLYPFDPEGTAEGNRVLEQQPIESNGLFDYYYIIPDQAPFYAGESLKLKLFPGGRDLIEGKDYILGHHFMTASHTIGQPVYGSIYFLDRNMKGIVDLDYQTLGGIWTLSENKIAEILANELRNPRTTSWESIVDLPARFPVVNHSFDIEDFVGMKEVQEMLLAIQEAIREKGAGALDDHLADKNNPHEVNKEQVGLGLVDNFPTASIAEAQTGTRTDRFMTPLRTRQAIEAVALTALNAHIARVDNPHAVTKAQVGLGSVQNFTVSTQAEAEAGASNARYMTPVRTREAIEYMVLNDFNDHVADTTNPHAVTKGQVGLALVDNFGTAVEADGSAGIAVDKFMTPLATRAAIQAFAGDRLDEHMRNRENPHGTTKAHVGLGLVENYPIASESEARDATLNDKYMTPLRTRQLVNELVGEISGGHASDHDNPHRTTKAQVGLGAVENFGIATEVEASNGDSNEKYMTPFLTNVLADRLAKEAVSAFAARRDNPNQVTAAQVGAATAAQLNQALLMKLDIQGTAYDTERVFGMPAGEFTAWITTLKSADSVRFDGRTFSEAMTEILRGTAANANSIQGMSAQQIVDLAVSQAGSQNMQASYYIPAIGAFSDPDTSADISVEESWTKVLTYFYNGRPDDLAFSMTGGRDTSKNLPVLQFVQVQIELDDDTGESIIDATVTLGNATSPGPELFYRELEDENLGGYIEIWMYDRKYRRGVGITDLSGGRGAYGPYPEPTSPDDLITAKPTGLVEFAPAGELVSKDELEAARSQLAQQITQSTEAANQALSAQKTELEGQIGDARTAASDALTQARSEIDQQAAEHAMNVDLRVNSIIADAAVGRQELKQEFEDTIVEILTEVNQAIKDAIDEL